jgi:hypothetical protein
MTPRRLVEMGVVRPIGASGYRTLMDDKQLARFRQAVEDKNEAARERADAAHDTPPEPEEPSAPQDTPDERAKSTGHGKKTADKWNQ